MRVILEFGLLLSKSFLLVLAVEINSVGDRSFILTNSLLEHIKGPRDDLKLGDHFFKSLSEILSCTTLNTSVDNCRGKRFLKTALGSFDHLLLRLDYILLSTTHNRLGCRGL